MVFCLKFFCCLNVSNLVFRLEHHQHELGLISSQGPRPNALMKVWIWFPAAAQTQRTNVTLNRVCATNQIYSLLFCTMLPVPDNVRWLSPVRAEPTGVYRYPWQLFFGDIVVRVLGFCWVLLPCPCVTRFQKWA